ncbi:MAG: cadherin domain-containing protein [Magnetococcales bacterium]|nr:cadherin domain-containing protein [Magnetococcales bacterium]
MPLFPRQKWLRWVAGVALVATAAGGWQVYDTVRQRLERLENIEQQQTAREKRTAGAVSQVRGTAWSEFGGARRQLATGDAVYGGDRIVTGRRARLILRMADGAVIALGEETELFLQHYIVTDDQEEPRGILELARGFLRTASGQLAKMRQDAFQVATPVATLGVRGTEYWGYLAPGSEIAAPRLELVCLHPTCLVDTTAGQLAIVEANQETQVSDPAQLPSPAHLITAEKLMRLTLSTVVPTPLPAEAVASLLERAAQKMVDDGAAGTLEEARRLVESSRERLVEAAEWDAAARVVQRLVAEKGQVTQGEVMERIRQKLTPEQMKVVEATAKDRETKLQALESATQTALAERLPAAALHRVLEQRRELQASRFSAEKEIQRRLAQQLPPDQLAKALQVLREVEGDADLKLEMNARLSAVLPPEAVQQVMALETQREGLLQTLTNEAEKQWKGSMDPIQAAAVRTLLNEEESARQTLEQAVNLRLRSQLPSEVHATVQDVQDSLGDLKPLDLTALTAEPLPLPPPEELTRLLDSFADGVAANLAAHVAERGGVVGLDEMQAVLDRHLESLVQWQPEPEVQAAAPAAAVTSGTETPEGPAPAEEAPPPADSGSETEATTTDAAPASKGSSESVGDVGGASSESQPMVEGVVSGLTSENVTPFQGNVTLSNLSVDENSPLGTLVGIFTSTRPEDQTFGFWLPQNAQERFTVNGTRLEVWTPSLFDYESGVHAVNITVRSHLNPLIEGNFTIAINDVNEAPASLNLVPSSVPENSVNGTVVGNLTASDVDAADAQGPFTFDLVDNAGGRFALSGNQIVVADGTLLDYERYQSLDVQVQATDPRGVSNLFTLTIHLTDVMDSFAATSITLSPATVAENSPNGTLVGNLTAVDPDDQPWFTDTRTYTLLDSAGGRFTLGGPNNDQILVNNGSLLNYEANAPPNPVAAAPSVITVRVTDYFGLTHDENISISLIDVNEAPTALFLDNTLALIDSPAGDHIGQFYTLDPDIQDQSQGVFTYEFIFLYDPTEALIPSANIPSYFGIGETGVDSDGWNNELVTGTLSSSILDAGTYTMSIRAHDSGWDGNGSLTVTQEFTITALDWTCQFIPQSPTVTQMRDNARATYKNVFRDLYNGTSHTLTAAELEELILGKVDQQATANHLPSFLNRFDVQIDGVNGRITLLGELHPLSGIHALLVDQANSSLEAIFGALAQYTTNSSSWSASNPYYGWLYQFTPDTACVRIRIQPLLTGTSTANGVPYVTFDTANATISVRNEATLTPDVENVPLTDIITLYNTLRSNLKSDFSNITGGARELRLFTGGGSAPLPAHQYQDIIGNMTGARSDAIAHMSSQQAVYPYSSDITATGQAVPLTQRLDYFFPGLVHGYSINNGSITLTP